MEWGGLNLDNVRKPVLGAKRFQNSDVIGESPKILQVTRHYGTRDKPCKNSKPLSQAT